jgi:hypothetical protein
MLRLGASIALVCLAISGSLAIGGAVSIARDLVAGIAGFFGYRFMDARNGSVNCDG